MGVYYGIQRSSDYLAHYGVKGMRWGVRKAIDAKDTKALARHYDKATRKLAKLQNRANLLVQKGNKKSNLELAGLGAASAGSFAALGALNKHFRNKGMGETYFGGHIGLIPIMPTKASTLSNIGVGIGGAMGVGGSIGAAVNHHRLGIKGHKKAVDKVNAWQKEMTTAFKDTKYEKELKNKKPYKDEYELTDYSQIKNGKPKVIAKISGEHLTRNYKGKDKTAFLEKAKSSNTIAIKSPRTYNKQDPYNGYETTYEYLYGKKRKRS